MAGSLQGLPTAEAMLQAALDLVLEKLGLEAGWVLWGESDRGELELAASRGISERFVRKARNEGIGECLCRDVFETGRLRFARNTTECPRMPEMIEGPGGLVSHACIPLKFERGTLGVMNIANRPGRTFSPQELQFLETVGNQVCLAVDKSRTAQAESRRNAEARALSSLATAIGGSLDEKRVLSAVGDYTRELLGAERCLVFLGDDPSNLKFAYLAGAAVEGLEVGRTVDLAALGSRAFAGALRQRLPLVIPNALEDPRANADLARRWKIGSTIIVPLVAHDRLGGLLVAARDEPSPWSEGEVQLTNALAGQAAVAIESARLYREAQEALLRLQQAQYGMMRAERLAAVGTLASSLAHEVRNPLNSINLQLVLLSRRVAKIGEPMQAELGALLDTARREIARLDGLVEEFLSLSSIDRISLAENQPEDVVREVMGLMTPVARDRNVVRRRGDGAHAPPDSHGSGEDQAGSHQPGEKRHRGDARGGQPEALHPLQGRPPDHGGGGHGHGDRAGSGHLRLLRDHEAGRHRTGPPHRPAHRGGARRLHELRERARARNDFHRDFEGAMTQWPGNPARRGP